MSPEGPKDPKEKDFSGYGDVKCVKANGDDGIGNNIIESARGKGVKDYYCVVQWDKPDCSGGHLWMDDHMSEDHQCESLRTYMRIDTNCMILILSQGLAAFSLTLSD
jgi:hypothetical protein